MSFKPYPKYKESGVEWLGRVPEHWEVMRLGYLASRIGSGKTPSGGADNYCQQGVLFLRSQNIYDEGLRLEDVVYITQATDDGMPTSRVLPGDILLNITGASLGRTCVVPDDFEAANVNQHVCVIRLRDTSLRAFLSLLLKSAGVKSQLDYIQNGAAREGLNFSMVSSILCPLPSPEERDRIATFLDHETAKIDALIAEQQRLIELLQEKRQAVISHAVTKGLNPDVPMKDSGIEWLGEVPEHWEVRPLKSAILKIEQGWSPQCESYPAEEGEWGVLKVGCVNGDGFNAEEQKALPREIKPLPEYEVMEGDILASRGNTLELVGQAAFIPKVRERLMLSDLLYRFRPQPERAAGEFLVRALRSGYGRFQIERSATGTSASMKKVSQGGLKNLLIALPPLGEQHAILTSTSTMTAQIDRLSDEARSAITLLQERRSALISAAVTGQIDVRGFSGGGTEAA